MYTYVAEWAKSPASTCKDQVRFLEQTRSTPAPIPMGWAK